MKQLWMLLLVAVLLCACAAAEGCTVDADVTEQVFTVSATEDYDGTGVHAEILRVQYVGEDAPETALTDADAAYDYAWENLGVAGLTIYAPENEEQLRFVYDGIAGDDVGDYEMVDYNSWYDGYVNGQIRRIYYHGVNRYNLYIKYYLDSDEEGHSRHLVTRVEYDPETGEWKVSRFDTDVIRDSYEAVVAGQLYLTDYCGGFDVETEKTGLNIRETPGGEIIESLEKGTRLMVFRYQMVAQDTGNEKLDGVPFILVAKMTEPDDNGIRYYEYYGWCASEYLAKEGEFLWTLSDQLADGTEKFPEGTPILEAFGGEDW